VGFCGFGIGMEKISEFFCSDCGTQVDPESARIFQKEWYLDGSWPEAEYIEVNWENRTAQKGVGSKPKQMVLCLSCAKRFHKEKVEGEWRSGILFLPLTVLLILIFFVIYLLITWLHGISRLTVE
jgi:hypothetical protein